MPKKIGIRQKLSLFFLMVFLPLVAFCVVQQIRYDEVMRDDVSNYNAQLVDKIAYDIELGLGELDSPLLRLLYDDNIMQLLQNPDSAQLDRAVNKKLGEQAETVRLKTGVDCNILLLNSDMKILVTTYEARTGSNRVLGAEWRNKINAAQSGRVIISAYSVNYSNAGSVKVVSIARAVRLNGRQLGVLMAEIPLEYFARFCDGVGFGSNGYMVLTDSKDYVVYSTDSRRIGSRFHLDVGNTEDSYVIVRQNNMKMFCVVSDMKYSDLHVIAALPLEQINVSVNSMRRNMIAVLLLIGAASMALAVSMANSFCKPIIQLESAMKQLETGDFSVKLRVTRHDEIGELQEGFSQMASNLKELIEKEYQSVVREREAQLNELLAMIDPHFMYNTLEAISMTAYLNDDTKTVKMLGALADIYRYRVVRGEWQCALAEELKNLDDYLYLINIRSDGGIRFHKMVDEALLGCQTQKHMLQPLVENCIVHGFKDTGGQGDIWLEIRRADADTLEISVSDNGCGVSGERLAELRRILSGDKLKGGDRPYMVLKNIHDRLVLVYGSRYGVILGNRPEGGFNVRIHVPYIKKGDDDDPCVACG